MTGLKKNLPYLNNQKQGLIETQNDEVSIKRQCELTCNDFINVLKRKDIRISMDGRGRALDNIMIERLWRSVKYEEVYLKDYQSVRDAYDGLNKYLDFYNNKRIHQSLEYKPPASVHFIS